MDTTESDRQFEKWKAQHVRIDGPAPNYRDCWKDAVEWAIRRALAGAAGRCRQMAGSWPGIQWASLRAQLNGLAEEFAAVSTPQPAKE